MTKGEGHRLLLVTGGLALGGGAIGWVVKQAGVADVQQVVTRALPFLALVFALEGCRIATELFAAQSLFGRLKGVVPTGALVRAQLVGYAVCNVLPVGRAACEATKAGLLAPHAGLPKTAAVATIAQALHLIASAIILVPCVVAARHASASLALSLTIFGQCALLAAIGGVLLLVAYFAPRRIPWLKGIPKLAAALEAFRAAMRQLPSFPIAALGWLVLHRVLQVVLLAVLLRAVGSAFSLTGPLMAEAVSLIGASTFDFVPGQIGALEAAFGLFATVIGTTPANAVAVALLIHIVQSSWVLAGVAVLLLGRRPVPSSTTWRL